MLIALLRAAVIAVGLEQFGMAGDYGAGFKPITILTLLGTTGALVVLARIVDREGLGSGFAVLLLAEFIPKILGPFWERLFRMFAPSADPTMPSR